MLNLAIGDNGTEELDLEVLKMVNLGRTARDASQIKKHLEELKRAGISVTSEDIPTFYLKLPDRITTNERIEVLPGAKTSGEVEYVLILTENNIYITVGSDHSDREVERYSIVASKQMCPNVLAKKVWRYSDVKGNWDDLVMRAWVEKDGQRRLYQEGELVTMLRPEEVIEKVKSHIIGDMQGMVIYAGTLPIIGGEFCFSLRFEFELIDEHARRAIRHAYSVEPIAWFE